MVRALRTTPRQEDVVPSIRAVPRPVKLGVPHLPVDAVGLPVEVHDDLAEVVVRMDRDAVLCGDILRDNAHVQHGDRTQKALAAWRASAQLERLALHPRKKAAVPNVLPCRREQSSSRPCAS